ncbi:hypothetical protein RND71_022692 [Anisodus tanguticus]|uniref:Uncharacterized protein n=1 Tax=Anisodus tanguticus TaxID=243964 RepID=A0AAE1V6C8_9SOLA|nr:hypothetical protein RND71_022692 [Anisodus tanguticus]
MTAAQQGCQLTSGNPLPGQLPPPPTNPDGSKLNFMAAVEGGSKLVKLEHKPYELIDGKAKVTFSNEEGALLANKCRMTVVGKFSRTRPQIDRLRDEYKRLIPMRGIVKIGDYDWRHVFMDFTDEEQSKR